jgi:uncharacterized protein (TIRG00374 family)
MFWQCCGNDYEKLNHKDLTMPWVHGIKGKGHCMTVSAKPRFNRKILLFVTIGLATLVFYLYYFVGTVNIAAVIRQTNLFFYASAFVAFLASALFSALAWQSLMNNLAVRIKIRKVLLFVWAGMFVDVAVPDPGWSGDLSKAYLLAKSSGEDAGKVVASVVGQKVIGIALGFVGLIVGLLLLASNYTLPLDVLIFIVLVLFLTVFSLFLVSYLSAKPKVTKRMLDWLIRVVSAVRRGRWDSSSFSRRSEETLERFHEGMNTLRSNPRGLARPIAFSILFWWLDVSVVFLVFTCLGYPVPIDKVLIVYALTGSLQSVGISFVGFTEVVMSSSYTVLAIPPALSLSATLLTRVITLWFKLVISYIALQWAGIEMLLNEEQTVK